MPVGTVIHAAVNLGSHPYMLHYDFVAADKSVKLAYLSQKHFIEAIEGINNAVIDQIGDYLLQQNGFNKSSLSKGNIRKLIKNSKLMNLPKGWKYKNDNKTERLYMILKGSMRYEYGNPGVQLDGGGAKKVNLRNFLAGGFKPVSIQDRIIIEKDKEKETQKCKAGKKQ